MSRTFPTSLTYNSTIRGNTYTNEFTDKINNLNILSFPNDYYLGWVRPEYVPDMFKACRYALVEGSGEDDDIVEFIRPSYEQNVAFGYSFAISDGLANNVGFSIYKVNDESITKNIVSGNPRLINTFYPEALAGFRSLRLRFNATIYNPVGDIPSVTDTRVAQSVTFTSYRDFMDFRYGRTKKLLNFKKKQGTVIYDITVEVTGTDFENGYAIFNDIGGVSPGWQAKVFLGFIGLNGWYFTGANSTSDSNYIVLPMFGQTLEYHFTDSSLDETVQEMQSINFSMGYTNRVTLIQYRNGEITEIEDRGHEYLSRIGCPQQNTYFTQSEIVDGNMSAWSIQRDGLHMVKADLNSQKYVYRYCKIEEIEQFVNLISRVSNDAIVSYSENVSYATRVNSNEFVSELITGSIYDQAFRDLLQDWQYVPLGDDGSDEGTAKQEFDPTDPEQMPPYVPIPPEPPSGEEGHNPDNPDLNLGITEDVPGDSVEPAEYRDTPISFPVSAFLTQYVLSAQDIFDMGYSLWSGIGDPNSAMASNFVKTYTSTGTLNISNVMDFFVSVKVFPFDLLDFNVCVPKTAMTVGTGAVPLLNRSVWVLGVSTYTLECGTVQTLQDGAFRLGATDYDFRNYINCTYTVFLPFCGNIELNPADVFPYELSCKYFIDFISGSCTGCVYALRDNKEVLVGSKTGQIGKIVPITASNVNAVVGAALSDVSNLMQTIGGALISAATNKALGASQMPVNEASKSADYLKKLNDYRAEQNAIRTQGNESQGYLGMATKSVSDMGNMMSRSGINIPSLSGGTGLDALHISKRPYLAIRRLNYCSPNQYAHTTGFAGTDGSSDKPLGRYQGWTVLENPDLSSIKATQEELSEIKYLLETGVYV